MEDPADLRWKTEKWEIGDTLYLVELPDKSERKLGEAFELISFSPNKKWVYVKHREKLERETSFYVRRFSRFYNLQLELFDEP